MSKKFISMQDRKIIKYTRKRTEFISQPSVTISRRDDFSDSSSSVYARVARARACQCDDGVSGSDDGGDGSALL